MLLRNIMRRRKVHNRSQNVTDLHLLNNKEIDRLIDAKLKEIKTNILTKITYDFFL